VRLSELVGYQRKYRSDALHGIEHDRVLAHPQIVIRAPNIHLILRIGGMRYRELGGEAIDIVEVAVRPATVKLKIPRCIRRCSLVLVLLVQLGLVKRLVVEQSSWRRLLHWLSVFDLLRLTLSDSSSSVGCLSMGASTRCSAGRVEGNMLYLKSHQIDREVSPKWEY